MGNIFTITFTLGTKRKLNHASTSAVVSQKRAETQYEEVSTSAENNNRESSASCTKCSDNLQQIKELETQVHDLKQHYEEIELSAAHEVSLRKRYENECSELRTELDSHCDKLSKQKRELERLEEQLNEMYRQQSPSPDNIHHSMITSNSQTVTTTTNSISNINESISLEQHCSSFETLASELQQTHSEITTSSKSLHSQRSTEINVEFIVPSGSSIQMSQNHQNERVLIDDNLSDDNLSELIEDSDKSPLRSISLSEGDFELGSDILGQILTKGRFCRVI